MSAIFCLSASLPEDAGGFSARASYLLVATGRVLHKAEIPFVARLLYKSYML